MVAPGEGGGVGWELAPGGGVAATAGGPSEGAGDGQAAPRLSLDSTLFATAGEETLHPIVGAVLKVGPLEGQLGTSPRCRLKTRSKTISKKIFFSPLPSRKGGETYLTLFNFTYFAQPKKGATTMMPKKKRGKRTDVADCCG